MKCGNSNDLLEVARVTYCLEYKRFLNDCITFPCWVDFMEQKKLNHLNTSNVVLLPQILLANQLEIREGLEKGGKTVSKISR